MALTACRKKKKRGDDHHRDQDIIVVVHGNTGGQSYSMLMVRHSIVEDGNSRTDSIRVAISVHLHSIACYATMYRFARCLASLGMAITKTARMPRPVCGEFYVCPGVILFFLLERRELYLFQGKERLFLPASLSPW